MRHECLRDASRCWRTQREPGRLLQLLLSQRRGSVWWACQLNGKRSQTRRTLCTPPRGWSDGATTTQRSRRTCESSDLKPPGGRLGRDGDCWETICPLCSQEERPLQDRSSVERGCVGRGSRENVFAQPNGSLCSDEDEGDRRWGSGPRIIAG